MAYKGVYSQLKHPKKYKGDLRKITYRSLWERSVMKYMDESSNVIEWNSETVVIPYICATDNQNHSYYVDFYCKLKDGSRYIIEVKPSKQVLPPKPKAKKTRKFLSETLRYSKNKSKWKAAELFAKANGLKFLIWTEKDLQKMGIIKNVYVGALEKPLLRAERQLMPNSKYNPKNRRRSSTRPKPPIVLTRGR